MTVRYRPDTGHSPRTNRSTITYFCPVTAHQLVDPSAAPPSGMPGARAGHQARGRRVGRATLTPGPRPPAPGPRPPAHRQLTGTGLVRIVLPLPPRCGGSPDRVARTTARRRGGVSQVSLWQDALDGRPPSWPRNSIMSRRSQISAAIPSCIRYILSPQMSKGLPVAGRVIVGPFRSPR